MCNLNNLTYIEMESTDAAFHFCVELFAMQNIQPPVLMLWQTKPTVMLGRNQIAASELDMDFADRAGIEVVRRPSGGGAIYTDGGTILYTLILPEDEAEVVRTQVAGVMVDAFRHLGIPAELKGRNDICAEEKKFSGMAQHVRHKKICTHGSILFNTDLEQLVRVLTVEPEKLKNKGVRSVRSRVTNVKKYIPQPLSTRGFKEMLKTELVDGKNIKEYCLNDNDIKIIRKIYDEQYSTTTPPKPPQPPTGKRIHKRKRFPGGNVEVFVTVEQDVVRECSIHGDFLGVEPIKIMETQLKEIPFNREAFITALKDMPLSHYLGGISQAEFLSVFFETPTQTLPKPEWLRLRNTPHPNRAAVENILNALNINTVCHAANCPNTAECFSKKMATFMLMGTACTRNCRFCNVQQTPTLPLDPNEPQRVAQAVAELGLQYVVITSVTRDDLPDGGAEHFAETIQAIRQHTPQTIIEVLIPDLQGNPDALKTITNATPHVISHNMETVVSLYPQVRPEADYARSLHLLKSVKEQNPNIKTKSGFMLGLGETDDEVQALLLDIKKADCDVVTIGQYLAPSSAHFSVRAYIPPARFDEWATFAKKLGFTAVAAGPLVRSSYRAGEFFPN